MNLREECKKISDLFCDTVIAYRLAASEAVAGMSEEHRIEYFIGEIASCNSSWSGGPYGPANIDEYIRRSVCIDLLKKTHFDQRMRGAGMNGKARFIPLKKFVDGHKFFIDRTNGRIAVADNSGIYPDGTDDGVMWLDFGRGPRLDSEINGFPVETARGEKLASVTTRLDSLMKSVNGDTKIPAGKRKEIADMISWVLQDLGPNLGFVGEQFERHMDGITSSAKAEIEAMLSSVVQKAGVAALNAMPKVKLVENHNTDKEIKP